MIMVIVPDLRKLVFISVKCEMGYLVNTKAF